MLKAKPCDRMSIVRHCRRLSAFTLIEVLIALVILAVALVAITVAFQRNIPQADRLRTRLEAHWVAMDLLGEMQTGLRPLPGLDAVLQGERQRFSRHWHWESGRGGSYVGTAHRGVWVSVFSGGHRDAQVIGYVSSDGV